ncbi:MAG: membrane protein insertase YidC [Gammaproteobacteria bacterium]|jgi:YidC/Oxa1 family membrane protein insertase|nr:membrane protein insertase YidC [Gammaproteobacteria bacterium]
MEHQRTLLIISLALLIFVLWQKWMLKEEEYRLAQSAPAAATAPAPAQRDTAPALPASGGQGVLPEAPHQGDAPAAATPPAPEGATGSRQLPSGQRVRVVTDLLQVEIDTAGGDLRTVDLLHYPKVLGAPERVRVFNDDERAGDLLVAQSGLIGRDRDYPNHRTEWSSERTEYRLADGADRVEVPLRWTAPDGVSYEKVYVFHRDSYLAEVEFRVRNTSTSDWNGYLYAQFLRSKPPTRGGSLLFNPNSISYNGAAIFTPEEKYQKIAFSEVKEGQPDLDTASGWVAMLQHYFVSAWLPAADGNYHFYSSALAGERFNIGYKTTRPVAIAAGQQGAISSRLFVGPKEQDRLEKIAGELSLTVDYGWLTIIAAPLFWLLDWLHRLFGNWGWAIIGVTVLLKAAFYPLSAAGFKSMARMKAMQPRIATLRERHQGDKQKLNQAMMELYQKEKINPLGGCLPILIQIPVFIALYWVLLESVELRQAPWAFWIHDLTAKDPYYVLPLLMGGSMLAQQFLNPAPPDPIQKRIMMALPVVFTFLFLFFPSGLVLYWTVNNVLSMAQQWQINRSVGAAPARR